MGKFYLPISCLFFLLYLFGCTPGTHLQSEVLKEGLDDKSAPYELFAFQRSFPDTIFDWKGWNQALSEIKTGNAAQARNGDCDVNSGNWQQQGPYNVGGRCNTLASMPGSDDTVLAGFSSGGIFKTTDGGTNWHPVFDDHLQLSIGDITYDPNNPNIVYAGTGDPNVPAIVYNGDGLYKSEDAGETWHYLALEEEGIISKVLVSPDDSETLFVAAMGNPYTPGNKRGIYKSKDGGQTWKQVLFVHEKAGASDLVQSPTNPNILYASFWDRIRNNYESIIFGEHAKVYKSEDRGETWQLLETGLPTGILGRTGLALSYQNPDKLYVVYIGTDSEVSGIYKTINGGDSFEPMDIGNLNKASGGFGWYFGKLRLNPQNDEDLYSLNILLYRKQAGSTSWISAAGGHADSHDLIFTTSGRRYWANDGGVYSNDSGSNNFEKCRNLPITQFYHTTFNPHEPQIYWGGTQDNGIQKGSAATGLNNWDLIIAADGFNCAFDPNDPKTFWVEIQNGTIHKTTDGGNSWEFGSKGLGTGTDRCSWDAPFFLSKFGPSIKLYSATYRVYFSTGSGWAAISPDLTDGNILGDKFHTITEVQESPLVQDKLMAGTSDGNVWVREPTSTWMNITQALPDRFVTSVQLSTIKPNRLFVTHSGFRNDEYIPHVHRSDDNGQTWKDISGNLPQIPVNDLFILPDHADSVLLVANDAGVYFSINSGGSWSRLGANMPVIPVFDVEENPVKKEIVAATFARGIWTFPIDSLFTQQPTVSIPVGGFVKTEAGAGINDVRFGSIKSNATGYYLLPAVPGCSDLSVEPSRNDNPLNGLTTYDLVLMSKHILGIEPLGSPYKIIAADANRSNSLTTFDIVEFRKLILGIYDTLQYNTSWRFVPSEYAFPNIANPFADAIPAKIETQLQTTPLNNLNFVGIKIGDVNDTAVPDLNGPLEERTIGTWPLNVEDKTFAANESFSVVFAADLEKLAALQFSLKFDQNLLQFESLTPLHDDILLDNFGMNRLGKGLLSVSIDNVTSTMEQEFPLFKLNFKANHAGQLKEALRLVNTPTPPLAYEINGLAYKPVLWRNNSAEISFAPNPVGKEGTWVQAFLGKSDFDQSELTLEIFDTEGNLIFNRNLNNQETVHIPSEVFSAPGVYFWRTPTLNKSGKLIYMR
ncbi:MAG: hypothetical protein R3A50_02595 [Saprospiraceae bacterium]